MDQTRIERLRPGPRARPHGGFTFLEVMIAATVLTVGSVIAYPTFISLMRMSRLSHETNLAMFDLEEALEDIQSVVFNDIETIYPNDEAIPEFEGRHLADERIVVHWTEINPDLLEIEVVCTWTSNAQGQVTKRLTTMRAR